MSNRLRYKSILFLLATIVALTGFGSFVRVSSAITAQEQARINEQVALDPLVRQMTEYVQAAQVVVQNAEQRVAQATAAVIPVQNTYDTALAALNAFVPDPSLSDAENNAAKQQLQNAVNAAAVPLALKKQLLADAQAALVVAQQDLAEAQQGLTEAKSSATTEATQSLQAQQGVSTIGTGIGGVVGAGQAGVAQTSTVGAASNQPSQAQTGISTGQVPPASDPLTTEQYQSLSSMAPCKPLTGGLMNCFAQIPYYAIYVPASWLLVIAGYIFDATITLSIDNHYVDQDFVLNTWTVIRDFSNMLFIFILLYTGIQTILGMGNWQKTVLNVIIIALLINFSLFFTKVVIDAGNILSVGIFESMGVAKESDNLLNTAGAGRVKERNLSQAIVANFQPAQFLSAASKTGAWGAAAIFIVAAIVNVFAAYILFKAALLFIGRLLAFWFLMIISPFALISFVLPKGNIFSWWQTTLISQAFVAPVFLFLLYLLMTIIRDGNLIASFTNQSGVSAGNFLFAKLLGPILIAIMLITALKYILKITEGMAGTFGSMASEYVGKAVGLAGTVGIGVATGGASLALRGGMGALATKVASSGVLEGLATSENRIGQWAGRRGIELTDKAKAGSWDIRGTAFGKATLGAGAKAVGMTAGKPIEGYEAAQKKQKEADIKFAKRLEVTDAEKKKKAEELEPEYRKAMESREGRRKERPAAREKMEEAEKAANNTPEGKEVIEKKEKFDKKDKSAKEVKETSEKKIKDLEKQRSEARLPEAAAKIDGEIKALKETISDAEDLRKVSEQELKSATEKLAATAEGKILAGATEKFKDIDNQIKAADEIIKRGDEKAKEWAKGANADRMERYAQQVEARSTVPQTSAGINLLAQQRKATAERIRKGESDEEKEEKALAKALKKAIADKEKAEKEEGKKEEKVEKKEEEKH